MVSTFRHRHTESRLKLPDAFPKESGARETSPRFGCSEVNLKSCIIDEKRARLKRQEIFIPRWPELASCQPSCFLQDCPAFNAPWQPRNFVVSRSRPFPFFTWRWERVWPTAIELPVLAFTQGRESVNWFEVSRQPRSKRPGCQADNESHYKPPVKVTLAARLPQTN